MKTILLFAFFLASTLALPKSHNEALPKRLNLKIPNIGLSTDLSPRITNGREAVPHSIPYQAYLVVLSTGIGGWSCGGSLISPSHVLTSAHCLKDAAGAYIHLGAHDIDKREHIVVQSRNLVLHEDYDETRLTNDIGLIVLEEPVELNQYVNIVELHPHGVNTDYAGEGAMVSGWGLTSADGERTSVLLEANTTVISNEQCRQKYPISDSHLCTLGDGGVCHGDSGSPLVIGYTQIGVVSFVSENCRTDYPSGYTRISSYLDWIEEKTGLKI